MKVETKWSSVTFFKPVKVTTISSNQMREAVLGKGFNPFKLGLSQMARNMGYLMGMDDKEIYASWINTTVIQSTTNWNICSG